jgi:hypothetical protein
MSSCSVRFKEKLIYVFVLTILDTFVVALPLAAAIIWISI